MNRIGLLVLIIPFFVSIQVLGQNISNEGTDFWSVFPTHIASGAGGTTISNHANIAIFVTSKFNSEATVSCGSYTQTKAIPANTAIQFDVTWTDAYIDFDEANSANPLPNKGIHIKVTDGMPKVSVYAHIYAGFRSAASLILPYETLGQTYYSMNYTQSPSGGNNFLTLVAADANTTLILHEKNGNTKNITFANAGDVYEYISGSDDLTGVYVTTDPVTSSCKRFAAFSGSSVLYIKCSGSQDPLYQQLYPTVSWGRNYGVVPFKDRRYILRILAQEDNTQVTYNGQTFVLNKGEFHESAQLIESTYITADKLISVAEYSLTQGCSGVNAGNIIGDPEMVIINPIEFNIRAVTVFSSTLQEIAVRYINVLMRTNKASTFKVDGIAPTSPWVALTNNPSYSYNQIPITSDTGSSTFSSLTLTADDGFNAIAYGFGQAESYSYSAGTNLSSNNYLTVVNESKNEEGPNGCIGQAVDFKVNLPYQADRIIWTLLEGGTPEVTDNPVPEIKTTNGQTIYVYRYPANKTYTTIGEYHLEVVAHVPASGSSCNSGDLTTNYVFDIYDLPTAKFDVVSSNCAKYDVTFTDQSISNTADFSITDWLWDFGDGSTLTAQNPKHQYAAEGDYTVNLSVKSGTGCYSDPISKTIKIYPLPVSKFTVVTKTCINTDVLFTDQSTISTGLLPSSVIKNWHWDFGDGTSADKTDATPFIHQFVTVGTFPVVLTTTSDKGCINISSPQNIEVTNLPVADFTMPDVCLNDAFAQFVNKSVDATRGNGSFTYEWNFGDINASVLNPNTSIDKDAKHKYSTAGQYAVSLKITNSNGCISSKTQNFIVNGAVEKADFSVQNESNLCSNTDVVINNTSNAFFGIITKIKIYKDFLNAPEDVQTNLHPTANDIHLTYPSFGGLSDKSYTIKLVAYSGATCFKEVSKVITLKPSPQLEFPKIPAVCQNDGSVIINEAKETSDIMGKGIYSGEGVNASGNFNPKVAGVGIHNIAYTFTADNGCTSSTTKSIEVYKSPMADAGQTIYILAGGEITIPATAEGDNLTYKWSPSSGLNKDDVLNPIATPEKDTEYVLTVTTNPEGCQATSIVMVKVLQALTPPNSFTPNGDNVNDVWNIKYLDTYPNATVEIFNRGGNRVFFSSGYKVPFDGNYHNEPLPVGVYYYIINPRNGRKTLTGPLTIIR